MTDDLNTPAYQMRKHSVLLDGHQTSVSMEDAFWDQLKAIAKMRGVSLNRLVADMPLQLPPESSMTNL